MAVIDHVNRNRFRFPLRKEADKLPGLDAFSDQEFGNQRYAQPRSDGLEIARHAFGNQHRRDMQRLFSAVTSKEFDRPGVPKMKTRYSDPWPRFKVSGFSNGGTLIDKTLGSDQSQYDFSRWAGDDAIVGDLARQDSNITPFLNHVKGTTTQDELGGDLGVVLQETAQQPGDDRLAEIDTGKHTQMTGESRLVFTEALVRFFGVSQNQLGIGQQALPLWRKAQVMSIAAQKGGTAFLLQHAQATA